MNPEPRTPSTRPEPDRPVFDAGPLGLLPRLPRRQARLQERLAWVSMSGGFHPLLAWLSELTSTDVTTDQVEVLWRPSGMNRSGLYAVFSWPRMATRFALGFETPVAHAIVDHLLGFERLEEEARLQVTPVEWGVLTFVIAEAIARLGSVPGPLGSWDLTLDRVGPDAFEPSGLGAFVTLRWPIRLGSVAGSVRLWLPESLIGRWLSMPPPPLEDAGQTYLHRFGDLTGVWRAEAGKVSMPRGLSRLRAGGVLPIDGSPLSGTPQSPTGPVELVLADTDARCWFSAEPVPASAGGHLTLTTFLQRTPIPREAHAVNPSTDPTPVPSPNTVAPADVPVTLTVELGRISLPLARLADLKPGDVLELGRHSREPVELTSSGRLVARGELVQIDTELGVRITHVFL